MMLGLAGCGNRSMETEVSANGAKSELIATVDGCRVWRLYDGHYVYFARCPEGSATTTWNETKSNGKTTSTIQRQTIGEN
jgi:hypothetical protein